MLAAAVVTLVYGLGFLLIPDQVLSWYGINSLPAAGILTARLFGSSLLGYAVLFWLAREAEDSEARRGVVTGAFASTLIGLAVSVLAQLASVTNSLGWLNVVVYLLLTLGFGY